MKRTLILLTGFCLLCLGNTVESADGINGDEVRKGLEHSLNLPLAGIDTSVVDYVTGFEHQAYRITGSASGDQFTGFDELARKVGGWFESQQWQSKRAYMADGPTGTSFAYEKDRFISVISVQFDESDLEVDDNMPPDFSGIPPGKLKYDLALHIFHEDPAVGMPVSDRAVPDITLKAYLVPVIVSNLVALLLIFICLKWPGAGRIAWALIFLGAGIFNIVTAGTDAQAYLMYGKTAVLSFYRQFISGLFSRYTALFVTLIGSGQILAAVLMLLKRPFVFLGITGGIIFLLAIAPLGIGSAFPCTLLMAASLVILFLKLRVQHHG